MRDDGQRKECHLQEGFFQRAAKLLNGLAQMSELSGDGFGGLVGEKSCEGEGDQCGDCPVAGCYKAALGFAEGIDGDRHVLGVGADDAEVVGVVADAGGNGAFLQPKASDMSFGEVTILAMAFDYRDRQDIFRSGWQFQKVGDQIAVSHTNDRNWLGGGRLAEVLGGHFFAVDGVAETIWAGERAVCVGDADGGTTVDQHILHFASLQVREQHDVRSHARRDESSVGKSKGVSGGPAGDTVGHKRGDALGDGVCDDAVNMPHFLQVQRIAVIGAEGQKGGVLQGEQGQKSVQIAGGTAFAKEKMESSTQFLLRLC